MNPGAYALADEMVRPLTMPMLVILGDRGEFFRSEAAVHFASALPSGQLAVLPGAGFASGDPARSSRPREEARGTAFGYFAASLRA